MNTEHLSLIVWYKGKEGKPAGSLNTSEYNFALGTRPVRISITAIARRRTEVVSMVKKLNINAN
jgi:hypothetical protein